MANINFVVKNDIELKGNLIFEGSTDNEFETTLAITNPTADRTITFPDGSGTVALTDALSNHEADTTAIHGISDTSKLATFGSSAAGRTIFVQTTTPTALAVGDIWIDY